MTKNLRRKIVLAALLSVSLATAQGAAPLTMPKVKPNALVSDQDQNLLQQEAKAFTGKACADAGLSSATMPKPPNLSFARAVEISNTAYREAKVIEQDVTDDSARMHVSMSGLDYFSFWSLVGGDRIKMLGCVLE